MAERKKFSRDEIHQIQQSVQLQEQEVNLGRKDVANLLRKKRQLTERHAKEEQQYR